MATTTVGMPDPAPESQQPINHFGRIIGTFFSPKATFESIAKQPSWILPVVLAMVVGAVVAFALNQKVDWREVASKRIEASPRAAQMTPEQKEQQLAMSAKISPAAAWGIGLCWPVLQAVIVGAAMLFAFNLIGGAGTKFANAMGIVAHAYVPWLLYSLLFVVILYLKEPGTVDLENPVATNVGAFLPESTPVALMSLGKSIDIFSIWTLFLTSMGFTAVNSKKLKGSALGIAIAVWAVYVLVKVGLAWIFS